MNMRGESIIEDYDEVEVPMKNIKAPIHHKRAMPKWLEAERYFKRYRDTQKVTLPRMQTPMLSQMLYSDGTAPITPMLTQDEGCGKVNS